MHDQESDSAFGFEGTWQEFAPIAFTNLLLTIVTLGIYRFWATARERRYLWSRSRFVDEHLEWTGTGMELFIGFLLVALLFGLPFFLLQFVVQGLMMRGEEALGIGLTVASFLFIFYLGGLAQFRALRYRLSRTRWRGIRGGSDNPGFGFGLSYMWKTLVGVVPLGLLIPWSMTSLWNERWNKMSFGPHRFRADAHSGSVYGRYLLFYLLPVVIGTMFTAIALNGPIDTDGQGAAFLGIAAIFVFFLYLGFPFIVLAYYAKFYREMVRETQWGNVEFNFDASTMDWFKLVLGDIALVIVTLGIGWIFLSYRHWKFFMVHMKARGEILLDELTQSTTATSKHGEGLLDAFDVGAI